MARQVGAIKRGSNCVQLQAGAAAIVCSFKLLDKESGVG